MEAKGGKDILKFIGDGAALPELSYLDVSESKQNIAFNLDTTADQSLFNTALVKMLFTDRTDSTNKHYFYLDLVTPKLTNLIINKIELLFQIPME